jgi:glycerol-3-phosphate acyltransferase PlsX
MKTPVIAIDAMGGDYAPLETVKGGFLAAEKLQCKIILVGDEVKIKNIMQKHQLKNDLVEIYHTDKEIPMDEKDVARAARREKDASIVIANRLVQEGTADAVIAAGNTGVATATSLFTLKRIEGFERPCICTLIPTSLKQMFLIDGGSNVEATAAQMLQNAVIGKILSKIIFNIDNARIGLLNIGEEEGKGTELYKETYKLLSDNKNLNFIGNVEGKTIIDDLCEVAVCDGFVGNIHLKALEGGLKIFAEQIKEKLKAGSPLVKIAALILKNSSVFEEIKAHVHPNSYGGALLGGVNGISIISHGSSNDEAIYNACRNAKLFVEADVINKVLVLIC